MKVDELLANARDAMTVRRVYGDPFEKDGVTMIPAAAVRGGGGGGSGTKEGEEGEGGGFGMTARPVGAYVLSGGRLSWQPAVDVNRVLATVAAVTVVFLLTRSRQRRAGRKAAEH